MAEGGARGRKPERPQGSNEAIERRAAQQQIAVEVLGRGSSYADAGEPAGVDARTIQRWMRDASFRARVSERRQAWVNEVVGQLAAAGPEAVAALRHECREATRSGDRVRAATALLTLMQRFRRDHEFEERLRALEERLGMVDPATDDLPDEADAGEEVG